MKDTVDVMAGMNDFTYRHAIASERDTHRVVSLMINTSRTGRNSGCGTGFSVWVSLGRPNIVTTR